VLSTAALALGTTQGAATGPLIIANENRNSSQEQFQGCVDEVRISNVARSSGQMQFYSPLVTITQNPVSQNVDYNQPVTFSVGASSLFALGYQWRYNSNSIAGATNSSYVLPNVAASNAGYYDCVVTNTQSYSATATPAKLVVGAANFIADRYSFNSSSTDALSGLLTTPDSIGGQTGTNFGDAVVTNGSLVLDGTSGTFMQLPPYLFTGANATALTVEFWATYGTNPNNVYTFAFGVTNYIVGQGIVGFNHAMYCPHNSTGQTASATPGDPAFAQTVSAPGNLDGQTVHVAVVFDPPDKLLSIYTNGVLEAVNTNFTVNVSSMIDQYSYIGRSLWAADPYLTASIDEIRIFRGALSSISIQQSDLQGPNLLLADGPGSFIRQPVSTATPLGQTATFSAAAIGYLPITYQWTKNGVLIPGATNASYSYTPTLADNGATFFCYATNTIGVTTYVTNSSSVTLSVFVPPTLSWLGTSDGGANNTWDTSSLDWTNDATGGGILAYSQTNGVLFDDRSGGGSVDVEQTIIPYNVKVNTVVGYALTSYSQLGSLSGQAALTKLGSGTLTIDLTNNLSGPVTVSAGELQVGANDSLGSLGSGPVTNNATISLYRGDTALVVGNAIHGTGVLSVDGSGAVSINGNSDYTGATLLNSGIVYLNSGTGFGNSPGAAVASGAQLYITGNVNVGTPLTITGDGDGNGALRKGGANNTVYTGPVTLVTDSSIGVDSGATLVLSNTVSGVAQLTALGGGTLTLAVPSTYLNGTTVNGPTVNLGASTSLGAGPVTFTGAGRLVLATGINFTNFVDAQTLNAGVGNGVLMVNDNTNGTVTTISGPVEFDASPASGGSFVGPTSSGYLNVTGPVTNTVSGVVTVRNGFVRFAGGGNYSTLNLTGTASLGANNGVSTNAELADGVSGNGTFDLNGYNQALTGLSDGATTPNVELVTNSVAGAATLTLDLSSSWTYSGVIAGNISLVVEGSGNEYLAGTNTYTGNTTVSGGSLELAQPTLAAGSTVSVASGAYLQLDFATTNTVSSLVLNGVSQAAGLYNSTTSSSYINGPGSLQVTPLIASNPTNITAVLTGSTLALSWPADHLGWLVQSNSVNLAVAADWQDIPASAGGTSYNITINPTQPQVFYRLRHP
jgi:autotransporter-associated beta strand protein